MSAPNEFDPAALEMLRRVGKDALVARMVGMFTTAAPARVAAMHTALDTNDADALVHAAHSFKASAGQLGAVQLHELLASIETNARVETNLSKLRTAVADAAAEVERAITWFNSQLGE